MKKKRNLELKSKDIFIIIFSLLLSLFFVFLFINDLNREFTKEDDEKIAIVLFQEKQTERRFKDRNLWTRLKENSSLYNGDYIRVSPMASSEILFNDKSEIFLSENTLAQIYIDKDGNYASISQNGGISVDLSKANSKFYISTFNGETIKVQPGAVVNLNSNNSGIEVDVKKGSAEYYDNKGVEKRILNGSGIVVSNEGTMTQKSLVVLSPVENDKIINLSDNSKQVSFLWSTNNSNIKKLRIEVFNDKKNSERIFSKEVLADSSKETLLLPNGKYYWKIFPLDQNGALYNNSFETGSFNVVDCGSLSLLFPVKNENFNLKDQRLPIRFSWEEKKFAINYELIVARDYDFNYVVTRRIINATSDIVNLDAGKYYWKVNPIYNFGSEIKFNNKNISTFNILFVKKNDCPDIYIPKNEESFYKYKKIKKSDGINFAWANDSDFIEYNFVLAKDSNFKNIMYNQKIKENHFFIPISEFEIDSTYYWKINAVLSDNSITKDSEVRKFSVVKNDNLLQKIITPLDGSHFSIDSVKENIFAWTIEDSDSYKIEFSKDKDFKKIVYSQDVKTDSIKGLQFEPGLFYWRVLDNDQAGRSTNVAVFIVDEPPHIPLPVKLLYPQDYKKFNGLYLAENSLNFNWSSNEKLKSAKFIIKKLNSKNQKVKYLEKKSFDRNQTVKRITPGKYYWQVIASTINDEDISSDEFYFEVSDIPLLKKPSLIEPVNKQIFDSAFLKNNDKITFKWANVKDATKYIFVLRKKDGKVLINKDFPSSINEFVVKDFSIFDNGEFYWSVKAQRSDADGYLIQDGIVSENTFSMHVQLPGKIEIINSGIQYGE